MPGDPRREAQRRADQIRAFRAELRALDAEGRQPLDAEARASIDAHHDRLLAELAGIYDIDRTAAGTQLSIGLRLASLVGGAALVAAISLLVARYWGLLALPAQVTLLVLFPLLALAGVHVAAMRERTRYIAGLFALAALGTSWLAIVETTRLLDLPFSALLLWPCAGVGIAIALSYGFRIVFALAMVMVATAVASAFFAAGGVPWDTVLERIDPLTVIGFLMAVLAPRLGEVAPEFVATARFTGLLIGLSGLLFLSTFSGGSLLAFDPEIAKWMYQAVMFVVCLVVLRTRLGAGDLAGARLAAAMLIVFLTVRYVDWFSERLPGWAFFLGLAVIAFGSIVLLRRQRAGLEAA